MSRALIALYLVSAHVGTSSTASCPPSLAGKIYVLGQSCYEFVTEQKTWIDAESYCHRRGGRLAMQNSALLQDRLSSKASDIFKGYQGVWLGLNDRKTDGNFAWDNYDDSYEMKDSYYNWNTKEPASSGPFGQHCAYMRRSYNWRWAVAECNVPFFRSYCSICEYRTVPPTTPSTLPVSTSLARSAGASLATTTAGSSLGSSPAAKAAATAVQSSTVDYAVTSSAAFPALVANKTTTDVWPTILASSETSRHQSRYTVQSTEVASVAMTTHSGLDRARTEQANDSAIGTLFGSVAAVAIVGASAMASDGSASDATTLHLPVYLVVTIALLVALAVAVVTTAIVFHLKRSRRNYGISVGLENPMHGS